MEVFVVVVVSCQLSLDSSSTGNQLVELRLLCDVVAAESDSEDEETATKRIIQQVMCCYCQYSAIIHTVVLLSYFI